jgi:hypothetical protein
MIRRTRHPLVLALTMSAIGLGFASIAWACTPNRYGKPSAPPQAATSSPVAADPAPAQQAAPDPASASAPAPSAASTSTASASGTSTGAASSSSVSRPSTAVSGTTRGASLDRKTSGGGTGGGPRQAARQPIAAGSRSGGTQGTGARVYGSGASAVRNAGRIAGVAHASGRPVPRTSAAPARRKAPSPRTAHAGEWSRSASAAKPAPFAAASSQSAAGRGGGLTPHVLAGLLILGIGLTGVFGGALAITVTRRRASAKLRHDDER